MRPLLVLRPQPGAAATLARAAALGLDAIAAPLFTVGAVAWEPADAARHDALMITSANAIRHGGAALALYHALPVYAVGDATAAAARAAGFGDVRAGSDDAAALLARMAADGIARPLHLAGREHRPAHHAGVLVTRRIVYAADAVTRLAEPAADALAAGAVALLHSPRAAALFARLVGDRAPVAIASLSPAIAAAAGDGWSATIVAEIPTDAALLACAARLAGSPARPS